MSYPVPTRLETGRTVCCGRGEGSPRFLKKTSEPFEECSVEIQGRYLSTPNCHKKHRRCRIKYTIVGGRRLRSMYILTNKLIDCLPSVIILSVIKGAQFLIF